MKRKGTVVGLLVAALAAVGLWQWSKYQQVGGPLVLTGNVEVRQVNLAFKVNGRIKQMLVDEGDHVVEGQILGSLDKIYFEENLAQIRAQRDQSKALVAKYEAGNRLEDIAQAEAVVAERDASLRNAKQSFDRAEQLVKMGSGTRKTYDYAHAMQQEAQARLNSARQALRLMRAGFRKEDVDSARAQLAEREAAVQTLLRQLADADLKAPSAGVVVSRVREAGAIVNAGETTFVLSLTTPVWVRTYVSETELGRIRPGAEVELRTDTMELKPFKGRIGFVSPTAEFTPKSVETRELRTALVYRLRVVAEDPEGALRQGMPITINVPPVTGESLASRDAP
jgi:HlyD family secretion protein